MHEPTLFPVSIGRPAPPAAAPTSTELRIRVATVPLAGARALHVGLVDGELRIATGYPTDDLLRALSTGVGIPLERWSDVAAAVATLLDGAT
jgi:hypothetical protein